MCLTVRYYENTRRALHSRFRNKFRHGYVQGTTNAVKLSNSRHKSKSHLWRQQQLASMGKSMSFSTDGQHAWASILLQRQLGDGGLCPSSVKWTILPDHLITFLGPLLRRGK
jgi:hypothetical protein